MPAEPYDTHEALARAICRETCAYRSEPPCFMVEDDDGKPLPWPNPDCDEPGCHALAAAPPTATPVDVPAAASEAQQAAYAKGLGDAARECDRWGADMASATPAERTERIDASGMTARFLATAIAPMATTASRTQE